MSILQDAEVEQYVKEGDAVIRTFHVSKSNASEIWASDLGHRIKKMAESHFEMSKELELLREKNKILEETLTLEKEIKELSNDDNQHVQEHSDGGGELSAGTRDENNGEEVGSKS